MRSNLGKEVKISQLLNSWQIQNGLQMRHQNNFCPIMLVNDDIVSFILLSSLRHIINHFLSFAPHITCSVPRESQRKTFFSHTGIQIHKISVCFIRTLCSLRLTTIVYFLQVSWLLKTNYNTALFTFGSCHISKKKNQKPGFFTF